MPLDLLLRSLSDKLRTIPEPPGDPYTSTRCHPSNGDYAFPCEEGKGNK